METSLIKTIKEFWCSRTNYYLKIVFFSDVPCLIDRNFLLGSSFIKQLWIMKKIYDYFTFCIENFFQTHQKHNLVSVLCTLVKSWVKIYSYFKFCIRNIWKVSGENCKASFRIFHYIVSIQCQVKSFLKGACLLKE